MVSMDVSGHVTMPWSIFKFVLEVRRPWRYRRIERYTLTVLQMAGKDSKKYGVVLQDVEVVAREIRYYSIFQNTYLSQNAKITDQLSKITAELVMKSVFVCLHIRIL